MYQIKISLLSIFNINIDLFLTDYLLEKHKPKSHPYLFLNKILFLDMNDIPDKETDLSILFSIIIFF